jgi:hypothetical protein
VTHDHEIKPLRIPASWDEFSANWMTSALADQFPGSRVRKVSILLRDDGTNRRARLGLDYTSGEGPATVFIKAESDISGRREIHAKNGNLFNEPLLFRSGVELPLEHPHAYASIVDEPGLDYMIVMEDLKARGADPLDATRPLTAEEAANGLRGLARLHSRYWGAVEAEPELSWVQPFLPTEGWLKPMRRAIAPALEQLGDAVPDAVRGLGDGQLVEIWTQSISTLTTGPQTLLHGDPHIGNTYMMPDGDLGFLDWQVVRQGNWAHDVGYFLQSALTTPDRRAFERELVEMYRAALTVSALERPSSEEAWVRYRASAAHGLAIWLVTLLSDAHAHERSLALVQRYAAAFVDLDTPRAVTCVTKSSR